MGSVIAAVILTATKLTVGFYTNSLGIISEALHSGIDLIAAVMTLFAVKAAARPPDAEHLYGHEKVESLSSLAETLLLFITCAWILYEAVDRLLYGAEVEITWVAILIMVMSMVIDFTRSRALHRTAMKYKSQALEADAIHFSTDLISSAVVIVGIGMTLLGFKSFDSYAAIGVAIVTAFIGYRLWKRSVFTLMDGAPQGISSIVAEQAAKVEGVRKVGKVRVRESGSIIFIDATVFIDNTLSLDQAHHVTYVLEEKIKSLLPNSDIVVHAEPSCLDTATLEKRIRAAAATIAEVRDVHSIVITDKQFGKVVEIHMELDGDLTVERAHELATELERKVHDLDLCINSVITHVEPASSPMCPIEEAPVEKDKLLDTIDHISGLFPEVLSCDRVTVHKTKTGLKVTMTCIFEPGISVYRAHDIVTRLEGHIRSRHTDVDTITIHVEPSA